MEELNKNDGWFGPEVRPENGDDIAFYEKGYEHPLYWEVGSYHFSLNQIEQARDYWVPWGKVLCWKSANPGPIPDRFKVKENTDGK